MFNIRIQLKGIKKVLYNIHKQNPNLNLKVEINNRIYNLNYKYIFYNIKNPVDLSYQLD